VRWRSQWVSHPFAENANGCGTARLCPIGSEKIRIFQQVLGMSPRFRTPLPSQMTRFCIMVVGLSSARLFSQINGPQPDSDLA
jgi:hypothetical protein